MLSTELNKPEYQTGSYAERLALLRSKTAPTVGRIEQGALKVLEAIIAAGLWRDKMAKLKAEASQTLESTEATESEKQLANIKMQVVAGFHEAISEAKLANKAPADVGGHSVNMNDPKVQQTFGAAQMPGIDLVTPDEVSQVMALATFQRPLFQHVSLRDVVAHFEPALVDIGEWTEFTAGNAHRILLKTTSALPESTVVRLEMSESHDGQHWTAWQRITPIVGIQEPGIYFQSVPFSGLQRKFRWRGEEYRITGTIEAV